MNVEYERSGCKQFFKKHRDDERTIKSRIETALATQLKTGMPKVKRAASSRVGGRCVYEFRVNLGRIGSARVAFCVDGENMTILFLTQTLQKDEFTRLLEHDLKEAGLCD